MADFINQTDIDSLLQGAALQSAGRPGSDVETYNFLRPHRISKERATRLTLIYQRMAMALQTLLSSRLRLVADVSVVGVEQATFGDFIMSLSTPCSAFLFDLGDRHGLQGVLDLGTDLGYYLIDRMFGGPGTSRDLNRPLTQLERLVLKGIVDPALEFFGEAWHDHLVFHPVQAGFESLPDQLSIANREDNVLVSNMDVKASGFSGTLTICVPLLALEPFLQEKRAAVFRGITTSEAGRAACRADIEARLRLAQVPVTARFPAFAMRTRDMAALQPGQVINTGFPLDVPVEIYINGRRRFLGAPGQARRRAGVRVTQSVSASQADSKVQTRARVV